jgi:serine/threonine-protein kinase
MTQGNLLGRYSILHELGRGATGAVYAARDRTTGAVIALKRIDPALLSQSDPNFAGRVVKQVRSARWLSHRNVARMDDAGEAGGTIYIAMELLDGESLRKILDDGPLAIARAIRIAHDIACGLAYAHLEGVMHGRLKPSNIMVLCSGVVKITDFGIGQLRQALQPPGAQAGCLNYMSPEQVRGDAVDHRADLFSLGALFYEMLAHRPAFEGDSPKAVTENILHAKPRPPSELNPHVPRALDTIVLSMLARQPADRMAGAPILLRELERLEEGLGFASGANPASDEPTASVPPAPAEPSPQTPEPIPQTPEPIRFQERAPDEAFQLRDQVIDRDEFDYHRAMLERQPEWSSRLRPALFAAFALVLAVVGVGLAEFMGLTRYTGLTGFMYDLLGRSERVIATSPVREPPAKATVASVPTAPQPVAVATKEPLQAEQESPAIPPTPAPMPPKALATDPGPSAQPASLVARAPEPPAAASAAPAQAASAGAAPAQALPRPMQAKTAEVPDQQRDGTARVIVAISPRGEIYIDGEHHGTTPPITTFDLKPGMHRIEVRSGSRKPYLTYMTVQAGDVRRIRHDFDAKPSRPPG